MSNYENSDGHPLGVGLCPHYSKVLLSDTPVQKPNIEVEIILAEKILTGDFAIEMEYTDSEGIVGFCICVCVREECVH